jgi:hypothetical protein
VIDPEGDYDGFPGALTIGSSEQPPVKKEMIAAFGRMEQNVVLNLMAVPLNERAQFVASVLPQILEHRVTTSRPHWLVLDEAHHFLGESVNEPLVAVPGLGGVLIVTVHPASVSRAALSVIHLVIALGNNSDATFSEFSNAAGLITPQRTSAQTGACANAWCPAMDSAPVPFTYETARAEQRRHRRKYATGELPVDRNFVFTGSQRKLNLRAQNLQNFMQMGDGVDDDTWLYHLRSGEYSKWFREAIKDEELARAAERIEDDRSLSAEESRQAIREAIQKRYTAPA